MKNNVDNTKLLSIIAIIISIIALGVSLAGLRGQYRKSFACDTDSSSSTTSEEFLPPSDAQDLPDGRMGVSDLGPQNQSTTTNTSNLCEGRFGGSFLIEQDPQY